MANHAPRPLHLVTTSTTPTPTNDVFSSPSPPSGFRQPKRYSMMAAITSSPSPTATAETKAARRQSSIGYYPPDSTESSRRGSLIRRNSLGALDEGLMLGGGGEGSWMRTGDRTSTVSLPATSVPTPDLAPGTPARERLPLTLTEKHADLLRFIAQKESKCLELRSQLVLHETELAQLKRNWERIVNRGLERDHHINGSDPSSAVFEGIKESVQGVSRLLAAGFSVPAPSSASPVSASLATASSSKPRPKPRPTSLIRKSHATKESDSSISTYITSRSEASNARFSQSSMSSYDEVLPNGDAGEECRSIGDYQGDEESSHNNDDHNTQILMVRDTGATPTMSPNPQFHHKQTQKPPNNHPSTSARAQLDGSVPPTPTSSIRMSERETWTSDIQATTTTAHRRKSHETARLDFEHLDFSSLAPSVLLSPPSMSRKGASPVSSPRLGGGSPSLSYFDNGFSRTGGPRSNSSSSIGALAPASSIPGLGSMTAGAVTPPLGSWMDSMGKKLGQIQRSSTFTKSQKRASLLLADMSNSIVNVLAPPSPANTSNINGIGHGHGHVSSNTTMSTNLKLPASASPNPSLSGSLLDDDEDDETMKLGAAVLQPVASPSPTVTSATKRGAEKQKKGEFEDEEWNW